MSAVESTVVFFPRWTTLAGEFEAATPPLETSQFGGLQLQFVLAGAVGGTGLPVLYLDESLDGVFWPADATTSYELGGARFFSVGFRLRWFRLRLLTKAQFTTVWGEGVLRAGGGGTREWQRPAQPETAVSLLTEEPEAAPPREIDPRDLMAEAKQRDMPRLP
jgi:hypothetical protein